MLFIDKYNIETEQDITFNHHIYKLVRLLVSNETIPHIMISGEYGSGKKSLVNFYIKEKFNLDKIKTNLKNIPVKCSNKEIDFNFMHSNYHCFIEPSKYGVYDKQIIQFILNDILQYKPINKTNYHLIVVNNADRLTIEAQQSLRRTLEKYIHNCRFIFLVNSNSSMIEPIKSRCLSIKLNSPTKPQIVQMLTKIVKEEKIDTNDEVLSEIVDYTKNLKEAINQLQLLTTFKVNLTSKINVINYLHQKDNTYLISQLLIKNATRDIDIDDLILELRQHIQDLLIECIDPITIVKNIFYKLYDHMVNCQIDILTSQLVHYTNQCIKNLKQCNKPIYSIEGYCLLVYELLDSNTYIKSTKVSPKLLIQSKLTS